MIEYFSEIQSARRFHAVLGGWLLQNNPTEFVVTNDEGFVADVRSQAFIEATDLLHLWDETKLSSTYFDVRARRSR